MKTINYRQNGILSVNSENIIGSVKRKVTNNMKKQIFNLKLAVSFFILTSIILSVTVNSTTNMQITVDATELPRKLLHSKITLELSGEKSSIIFPKWIPGIHAPKGPIENLAGFRVNDKDGKTISWERDWSEVHRFFVHTDPEVKQYDISLSYICNQNSVNSKGVDSYGYQSLGIISWNTIAVYPEGIPIRDIMVDLKLVLPPGWDYGTALPLDKKQGDTLYFKTVTFQEFIDMPLIAAEYFRTVKITSTEYADYYIHMAADDPKSLDVNDSILAPMENLVKEAELLFSRTHFDSYHFLLVLSDQENSFGLEHRNSSLNGVGANGLLKFGKESKRLSYLLSHEFAHAWCGKYRRPAGMDKTDYLTTKNNDLLWFYEGLDEYLGDVLATRSGFGTIEYYKGSIANTIMNIMNKKGRSWRSLRDTQVSSYLLRGYSQNWSSLRRSQDYYSEGALIWMEFDARIRNATDGKKSLDDFCALIFGSGDPKALTNPITLEEIITTLKSLADEPWEELINEKVNKPHDDFDIEVLNQTGYKIEYADKKSDYLKSREARFEAIIFIETIGLTIRKSGIIYDVVIGSPSDKAGLYSGAKIIAVNGKEFSVKRMEQAIKNTTETGKITLIVGFDDNIKEVSIEYKDGLRYFTISPTEGKPDRLTEILSPRAKTE
jgi:predicted metalloprotease with PDZ domain